MSTKNDIQTERAEEVFFLIFLNGNNCKVCSKKNTGPSKKHGEPGVKKRQLRMLVSVAINT